MPGREVYVILPGDIDDPAAPSGGNTYDRHVCRGLAGLGWAVREHPVAGAWPGKVVVVACEPASVEEMGMGLSEEVARAVDGEADFVARTIDEIQDEAA